MQTSNEESCLSVSVLVKQKDLFGTNSNGIRLSSLSKRNRIAKKLHKTVKIKFDSRFPTNIC